MVYQLLSVLAIICVSLPPIIPIVLLSAVLFNFQAKLVDRGQRDIKRASNAALAPVVPAWQRRQAAPTAVLTDTCRRCQVMSNLSETLQGRVTVRAMGCERFFVDKHNARVDAFTRMDMASQVWHSSHSQCFRRCGADRVGAASQSVLNFGNVAVRFPTTALPLARMPFAAAVFGSGVAVR
jgi:hypothetical protein